MAKAIFQIRTDADHFEFLWPRKYITLGKVPSRKQLEDGLRLDRGAHADLFAHSGHPVLRAAAWEQLEPILAGHVKTVPFRVGKHDFVFLAVPTNKRAFDRKRSVYVEGYAAYVKKYVIDLAKISEPLFFFDLFLTPKPYCTDALAVAIKELGLTGWDLKRVAGTAPKVRRPAAAPSPVRPATLRQRIMTQPSRARRPPLVDAIVRATSLEWDVQNGGFSQYVWNARKDPRALADACAALETIGHARAAALVREVDALWAARRKDHAAFVRGGVFDGSTQLANDLDRFSARYARMRVDEAILAHVARHSAELTRWLRANPR